MPRGEPDATSRHLDRLAARVIAGAKAANDRIITVESCTAGALACLLAGTPGAGEVFLGGFVSYAKICKREMLGLDRGLLDQQSAVSRSVAERMALNALERCPSATVSVSVTCVAGPEPDEDGNPVGLGYIAAKPRRGSLALRTLEPSEFAPDVLRVFVLATALECLLAVMGERSGGYVAGAQATAGPYRHD